MGEDRVVSSVNIPNAGLQIEKLLTQAVTETNAVFERDAIRPILAGDLPECMKELTMPVVENHEAILEATLTYSEGPVVKAFTSAPQVEGGKR